MPFADFVDAFKMRIGVENVVHSVDSTLKQDSAGMEL